MLHLFGRNYVSCLWVIWYQINYMSDAVAINETKDGLDIGQNEVSKSEDGQMLQQIIPSLNEIKKSLQLLVPHMKFSLNQYMKSVDIKLARFKQGMQDITKNNNEPPFRPLASPPIISLQMPKKNFAFQVGNTFQPENGEPFPTLNEYRPNIYLESDDIDQADDSADTSDENSFGEESGRKYHHHHHLSDRNDDEFLGDSKERWNDEDAFEGELPERDEHTGKRHRHPVYRLYGWIVPEGR